MKTLILLFTLASLIFAQSNVHIKGDKKSVFAQDASTEAIVAIDNAHHELHDGHHYFVRGYTTLGDGDSIKFALVTPNTTKWTHLIFNIGHSGITTVKGFKTATVTGGDTITPWNSDFNSNNVAGSIVISNPTIAVEGTCFDSTKAGSDTRFAQFGGSAGRDSEIILEQNATHLWLIISGAADNIINWDAEFYEHTNRQ